MLFLDGIRVAVEMADMAYQRLKETLGRATIENSQTDRFRLVSICLLDAWSIVDSINRLRNLLKQLPGFKADASSLRMFLRQTEGIWGLRNLGQHLDGRIAGLVAKGLTVWGVLTWLMLVDAQTGRFKAAALVSGSQFGSMHALPSAEGIEMHANIDHITLTVGGHEADLSMAIRAVAEYLPKLEEELVRIFGAYEFDGHEIAPSDFLLVADVIVNSDA